MGLLFVGGVMNLYWIIGLAVFILLEKAMPAGHWLGALTGIGLIGWGVLLLYVTRLKLRAQRVLSSKNILFNFAIHFPTNIFPSLYFLTKIAMTFWKNRHKLQHLAAVLMGGFCHAGGSTPTPPIGG